MSGREKRSWRRPSRRHVVTLEYDEQGKPKTNKDGTLVAVCHTCPKEGHQ